jgi:hypothetical protein
VVIRTESELNQELHGVNNDNIEATLSGSPEIKQEEATEQPVDPGSWPCLGCTDMQGPNDPFYDGQLCSKCAIQQTT